MLWLWDNLFDILNSESLFFIFKERKHEKLFFEKNQIYPFVRIAKKVFGIFACVVADDFAFLINWDIIDT